MVGCRVGMRLGDRLIVFTFAFFIRFLLGLAFVFISLTIINWSGRFSWGFSVVKGLFGRGRKNKGLFSFEIFCFCWYFLCLFCIKVWGNLGGRWWC